MCASGRHAQPAPAPLRRGTHSKPLPAAAAVCHHLCSRLQARRPHGLHMPLCPETHTAETARLSSPALPALFFLAVASLQADEELAGLGDGAGVLSPSELKALVEYANVFIDANSASHSANFEEVGLLLAGGLCACRAVCARVCGWVHACARVYLVRAEVPSPVQWLCVKLCRCRWMRGARMCAHAFSSLDPNN